MHCGCRVLPPSLENSQNRQNRHPHEPPVQHPCRSPQCRAHHTCCTQQRLHSTLQSPTACPGLATHTLARLCALWLVSGASTAAKLQHSAIPQPPQTTCLARPQRPVLQAPPHLLHTAESAFDLTVADSIPRSGTHTLAGLCALWLPSGASIPGKLHHLVKPQPQQTTCLALPQQNPVQAPSPRLLHTAEAVLALQRPMTCLGLATHALVGLCALLWLPSGTFTSGKLQHAAKPQAPYATSPD